FMHYSSSLNLVFGNPKAQVVNSERGRVASSAVGSHAPPCHIVPASTPEHAIGTIYCLVVDIRTPFPYVAQHIVQPPWIGLLLSNRTGSTLGVGFIPCDLI